MVKGERTNVSSSSRNRVRTGIALSAREIVAADLRLRGGTGASAGTWRATLDAPPIDGSSWASLATALGDLARAIGTSDGAARGALAISLLPPLAEVRRLELPPLPQEELQRLVARNAGKYFVGARSAQIVGTSVHKRPRGTPAVILAAATPARLIAVIRAAAAQAGWTVEEIGPAETAWASAAIALWPAFARQRAYAAFSTDERTDLLELEQGRLLGVRRFRGGSADADAIAETVGPTARLGLAGGDARRALAAALSAKGVTAATASSVTGAIDHLDVLAAQFSGDGRDVGPVFRADEAVAGDRSRLGRLAWMLGGAAAASLLLAAAIELWGVHRQLDIVRAEREALRPQLASSLIGRSTVDATARHIVALSTIEQSSPRWSNVLTTISEAIPDDAYLTAVRGRDDSLVVDGLAEHASRVFDGLQGSPALAEVRAAAAVRRDPQPDGAPLDHFTIAARIAPASRAHPGGSGLMPTAASSAATTSPGASTAPASPANAAQPPKATP